MDTFTLIDETYIATYAANLNINIEARIIRNSILEAQEFYLKRLLGKKLYDKIITLASDWIINGVVIPTDYKDLLDDYITKVVLYWTIYEAMFNIRYKTHNKGTMAQTSTNSTPIESDEFKESRMEIKNKAETLSQDLSNHLIKNNALYPELFSNNQIDEIQPQDGNYNCGIYLGRGSYSNDIRYHGHEWENRNNIDL